MRFRINLASHPYQDAREFYQRWGTALGAMIALTLVLTGFALNEWIGTRHVARQIADARDGIERLESERTTAQAILNLPENRGTRDRAQFINGLIARKAFSWTEVFSDLERLMPAQVHVVSIEPKLSSGNQLVMKINVAGNSYDKAVELVGNLEKSRHFREATILSNQSTIQPLAGGDTQQFEISALYIPGTAQASIEKPPSARNGGE
jgi:type IV pilus assembly protein PilN